MSTEHDGQNRATVKLHLRICCEVLDQRVTEMLCVCIGGGKYLMLHFLFMFPPWLVQVYVLLIASN